MHLYLSFLVGILIGLLCAYCAKQRGRAPDTWFMAGLFLGIGGLVLLYLLPKKEIEADKPKEPPAERVPLPPDPRFQEWFFLDQSRAQTGPIPFKDLADAWENKLITGESLVWTEGMNQWQPIAQLALLHEKLKP